ncbi:hypothetical protein AB0J38_14490 [Streptomyces sp. NPDC050095]|uniref:hypothetical protein n=1 Tax=unclassified Streptomyces TaxID=2593676 RepID=UPI003447337C
MARNTNADHNAAMLAHGHAARGNLGTAAGAGLPIDASAPWSPAQQVKLVQAEARIGALAKATWEAGEAFKTIKDEGLHVRYGLTWEQYCPARWGQDVSTVNRIIAAAPIMKAGAPLGLSAPGPARELGALYAARGESGVTELLSGVQEAGEKPTQANLSRIVRALPKQVPDSVDLRAHARQSLTDEVLDAEVVESPASPRAIERQALTSGQVSLLNEYLKREAAETGQPFDEVARTLLELLHEGVDGQPSTATNMLRARLV